MVCIFLEIKVSWICCGLMQIENQFLCFL